MATKKIEIEMDFMDGFVPPEKFDGQDWESKCGSCPFFKNCDDDTMFDECVIGGYEECPIKKYF